MAAGYAYDPKRALPVIVRGNTANDGEYRDYLERRKRLDEDAFRAKLDPVWILITTPETPAPSAHWRREFADAAARAACASGFAAIVTRSGVQRGVMNAIRWLQARERGLPGAYPTFDEACAAAERHRREPLREDLEKLAQAARIDLAAQQEPRREDMRL